MGRLIARRYLVLVDGFVVADAYAHFEDARACALTFPDCALLEVLCFWSRRRVWANRVRELPRAQRARA